MYANVGSDFPAFHKVVLELKSTLEEFERSYAPAHALVGKGRRDTASNLKTSGGGSAISTPASENPGTPPVPISRSHAMEASAQRQENSLIEDPDDSSNAEPAPPPIQANGHIQDDDGKQDDRRDDHRRAHSLTRPSTHPSLSYKSTSPLAPQHQHPRTHHSPIASARPLHQPPGADLMRKRMEYTASLAKMNRQVKSPTTSGGGNQGTEGEEGGGDVWGRMKSRAAGREEEEEGEGVDDVWGRMRSRAAGRGVAVPKALGTMPVAPMLGERTSRGDRGDGGEGQGGRREW